LCRHSCRFENCRRRRCRGPCLDYCHWCRERAGAQVCPVRVAA
jgi:hypothetical protein